MKPGPNSTSENGIYTGDCIEMMTAMPDECVDNVFTSPPYNKGIAYETLDDRMDDDEFWQFNRAWVSQAYRVTCSSGRLLATVGDDMLWRFREIAELEGWKFHQILAWCKPNLVGGTGRITKDWNILTEWCMVFHREKRTSMRSDVWGVKTHNWIVAASTQSNFNGHLKKVHPAQMPLAVALEWIARLPGDVVLDPFIGSGTTAIAAKMLNRQWIGIEIGTETAQMARDRIRDTQPPLFTMPQPEQMSMEL